MLIPYKPKKFSDVHADIITKTNTIIGEYGDITLTLRQVYYQFVGRGLFPDSRRFRFSTLTNKWVQDPSGTSNIQRNYKWLGKILADAKLAGLVSWKSMQDLTRELHRVPTWETPQDIVYSCSRQYKLDLWEGQPQRVSVWIEKDAGLSVIQKACRKHRVSYMSTRGFASVQGLHDEALRHKNWIAQGVRPVVILITDHDPSGVAMLPDLKNRFSMFGVGTRFKRIALTSSQIAKYQLPSDPCKLTDTRSKKYMREYGERAYELDALRPDVLMDMITSEIESHILDKNKWQDMELQERYNKEVLETLSAQYEYVVSNLL